MSHWITAHLGDLEIAELERGGFNPLNQEIYKALKCVEGNYCGVSGCGTSKTFTARELCNALVEVSKNNDLDKEREFLIDCLSRANGDNVEIQFF